MKIDITTETQTQLASVAAQMNTSPELLASQMLEQQITRLARFEEDKAKDMATLNAMENGAYVDNDAVMQWLDSWATDDELPCPKITK